MTTNSAGFYTLEEKIGRRSLYIGYDNQAQRKVIIKVLKLEVEVDEIPVIRRSILQLQRHNAPCIVNLIDCVSQGSNIWVITEYCSGGSCADLLTAGTFPEHHILLLLRGILQGLGYLHQKGISCQLRASNIFISDAGEVKLRLFTSFTENPPWMSDIAVRNSSPYWMAPEVIKGEPHSPKSDIWSLGITALEFALGSPPLGDLHPMKALFAIPKRPPPTLPQDRYSKTFRDFISQCLDLNPNARPLAHELLQHPFVLKYPSKGKMILELADRYSDWKARAPLSAAITEQPPRRKSVPQPLEALIERYKSNRQLDSFILNVAKLPMVRSKRSVLKKLCAHIKCPEQIYFLHETEASRASVAIISTSDSGQILVLDDTLHPLPIRNNLDLRAVLQSWDSDKVLKALPKLPWALCIMELLQIELKNCHLVEQVDGFPYRKQCMYYLRTLSKLHGILPPSYVVPDVIRVGNQPLYGGGFADVWKGELNKVDVCLKVLRLYTTDDNREKVLKRFCWEALVWKQLDHPNVLPFLGVSFELFSPSFCLISPWVSNGNLMLYLERWPEHDKHQAIREIAEAMCYLHEYDPPIVHADIRGANVLVLDDGRCCLADFGLASITEAYSHTSTSSTHHHGSTRWMSPEAILSTAEAEHDKRNHRPRDVYAFGCTILEVFTGKVPFDEYRQDVRVATEVLAGNRPGRPEGVFEDSLWSLIETCWVHDPCSRPSCREVLARLCTDGL